jgi:hypothetical protein
MEISSMTSTQSSSLNFSELFTRHERTTSHDGSNSVSTQHDLVAGKELRGSGVESPR